MTEPAASKHISLSYRGRFAPSPTGPLHLGSLIAALASYLDARAHEGAWLLRMEDLDPPREPEGAAAIILNQLEALHLHWDGPVLYQSQRLDAYADALSELSRNQLCFPCTCTRQRLKSLNGVYDGHCKSTTITASDRFAIRAAVPDEHYGFEDRIQGRFCLQLKNEVGDFVIKRKDGLFAYQLAVTVDDEFQQITDVVRGQDLLDSTPRQLYLQQQLGYRTPRYAHIPVIVDERGDKLSKQNFAQAIDADNGPELIYLALVYLGQSPDSGLLDSDCESLLKWGVENWDIQAVPKLATIPQSPDSIAD